MEVIFTAPKTLGNRSYKKGKQVVPDSLFYNQAFKEMVKLGHVQLVPRDEAAQKIQTARNVKAIQHAKEARAARKASKSAQGTSGTDQAHPSVTGPAQALPTPAKPVKAGARAPATVRKGKN
jgi:hypothetical protein